MHGLAYDEIVRDETGRTIAHPCAVESNRLAQDSAPTKGHPPMPSALVRRLTRRLDLDEYGRSRRPILAQDARIRRRGARDDDLENWSDDADTRDLLALLDGLSPEEIERLIDLAQRADDPDDTGMDAPPPFNGRPSPGGTMTVAQAQDARLGLTTPQREQRAIARAVARATAKKGRQLAADAAVRAFAKPPTKPNPGFAQRFPSAGRIGRGF